VVTIDRDSQRVYQDGQEIHLAPKEYGILELLSRYPGKPIPVERIISSVWGYIEDGTDDHAVCRMVYKLRQKLPGLIETRYKLGYVYREGA